MIKSRQKNWKKQQQRHPFSEKSSRRKQNNKNPFQEIIKTINRQETTAGSAEKNTSKEKSVKAKTTQKNNKSKNIHENYVFVWFFPIS